MPLITAMVWGLGLGKDAWRQGRRLGVLCMLVALCAWLGCSKPTQPLRIGLNAWPGYEFLYLAEVEGLFRARDVSVKLVEFSSLADARAALERGQIDGLGTTVVEVLMARNNTRFAPSVVHVVDYSSGADVIVARPGYATVESLRGRRIGVELGSLGVYVLVRALENHGMKLEDVVTVSSDQSTMLEQLKAGLLDAIVTYPPISVAALREPGNHQLFSSAEIPGEVVDVLAFQEAVTRERRSDVVKVTSAFGDAVEFAKREPEKAYAVMAKREGLTAKEFEQALTDGLVLVSAGDQRKYLGPGGSLYAVTEKVDSVLRQARQVVGPSGVKGAIEWLEP